MKVYSESLKLIKALNQNLSGSGKDQHLFYLSCTVLSPFPEGDEWKMAPRGLAKKKEEFMKGTIGDTIADMVRKDNRRH